MKEPIPDSLKTIGQYEGLWGGIVSAAVILALVGLAVMYGKFIQNDPQTRCISPAEVQMLCYDNGIDMKACKVRKPYIVKRAN